MPFIRLSDNYIDHPKIEPLSDGAFRLWHQMLAYCRRHQTDGLVPKTTLLAFKSYRPKRLDEVMQTVEGYDNALVTKVQGFGFKLHDYLEWNPTKDEENERRSGSKERMRRMRERRVRPGIPPRDAVTLPSQGLVTSRDVLDMDRNESCLPERERERKPPTSLAPDAIADRAARLLTHYRDWYFTARGARLVLMGTGLEFTDACRLAENFDDARLEKLAQIILTTDDAFISSTDRGFKIFVLKATWADDRLSTWEREHGIAV